MCYRLLVLCPVWALRHNAPLIRFLMLALYILFAFALILFSSLFPYLSPPLLIFSFENRPTPFCVFLCVVVHFFWLVNACFCCFRFSFFHTKPRDWLGETSLKSPILCWVRRKTTTQSIWVLHADRVDVSGSNMRLLWGLGLSRPQVFDDTRLHVPAAKRYLFWVQARRLGTWSVCADFLFKMSLWFI